MVLLLLPLLYFVADFRLDASFDSLLRKDDTSLAFYEKTRDSLHAGQRLVVSYEPKADLFTPGQLRHLASLRDALLRVDGVAGVVSVLDVPLFFSPPQGLSDLARGRLVTLSGGGANVEQAERELASSPLYGDNLLSANGKVSSLLIELTDIPPTQDVQALNQQRVESVRQVLTGFGDEARVFLGGASMISADVITYIKNDLVTFSAIVVCVMMMVLWVIFRHVRWVLMPIGISLMCAFLMTGFLGALGWRVTVVSSNFFSLLLVMTLSIVIHLIVCYLELAKTDTRKGGALRQAGLVEATVKRMFKPCLFTSLTTMAAFSSLFFSEVRPVADFGLIMTIGTLFAFCFAIIIFVLLMMFMEARSSHLDGELWVGRMVYPLAVCASRYGNYLLIVVGFIAVFSLFGLSKLEVENRFIDYFKKDSEIYQGLLLIDQELGGTIPFEVIVDGVAEDYWYDPTIRRQVHELHTHLEGVPGVGKVLSVDSAMQVLTDMNGGRKPNTFLLGLVRNNIPANVYDRVLSPYMLEETNQIRLVARVQETHPGLNRAKLLRGVEADLQEKFEGLGQMHLTGYMVFYNNILQGLFSSQIKTIGSVFLIILLFFLVIFRSFVHALIAIVPNIIPSLAVLGVMGWLGIPLDLMTITIAAITIGIGVDNAIHYLHRFWSEFEKDGDYQATLYRAHASIGLAMLYTSITVALGFGVFVFSNFVPSLYFGLFVGSAILSAMLINLTFLPKLLLLIRPKPRKAV